jgi:hypothetical protein
LSYQWHFGFFIDFVKGFAEHPRLHRLTPVHVFSVGSTHAREHVLSRKVPEEEKKRNTEIPTSNHPRPAPTTAHLELHITTAASLHLRYLTLQLRRCRL